MKLDDIEKQLEEYLVKTCDIPVKESLEGLPTLQEQLPRIIAERRRGHLEMMTAFNALHIKRALDHLNNALTSGDLPDIKLDLEQAKNLLTIIELK